MNTILRKQFLAHVGQTSPSPMLVEVERAEGSFFYTPEGKRYYDLVAGVSVSNVGHCNPAVVRAVQEQAARYMHVMVYGELVETPQVEYASKLASLLPGGLESVYFVNSGAEAVEGALKLAKRFTGRTELISMRRAYHGSTHGSMSMMGAPEGEEWKGAFRPLLPDVQAIEFNDFDALNRITRRTACVLAEPVQGEAGVRTPAPGYLEALRRRCAYLYIEYPDMEKELAILRAKLPHVDDRLCAQVALAVQKLRSNEVILKKPSIAETLDWAAALDALGIRELTPDALRKTAGFVLKNNEDMAALDAEEMGGCHCGGCEGHHHG